MDIDIIYIKSYKDERNIANLPWVIAHKRRKAGLLSSIDVAVTTACNNRSSYKLVSIDRHGRSPKENDEWNKVLQHAEKQARVRAVQMHLSCITTISALPVTFMCCERRPMPAMSCWSADAHTDEIEREWIYDTGAAQCMIGWGNFTDDEKQRTSNVAPQDCTTAGERA